jgi:hypothetical protein
MMKALERTTVIFQPLDLKPRQEPCLKTRQHRESALFSALLTVLRLALRGLL